MGQQTIHVPSDAPTIQAGIEAAQKGDTVLVAPGTYEENVDFEGKSIEVTSESSAAGGAAHTIILGSDGPTVTFESHEPASAVLHGFTIGHQSFNGQTAPGEGIFVSGASPTIAGNEVTYNDGCGISIVAGASPAIRGNDIGWNFSGATSARPRCGTLQYPLNVGTGIGIFGAGSVEISGNTITGNGAALPVSGSGGGIEAIGTEELKIENNTISSNTGLGAGAYGNDHTGAGVGAISAVGIGNLTLIQNLIYSNVVMGGWMVAGIGIGQAEAPYDLAEKTLAIINNTVIGNNQGNSGTVGEQLVIGAPFSQSIVENNIFESTDSEGPVYCVSGASPGFSYNDVFGGPASLSCGGFDNISADPQFVSLAVGNFHLSAASAAIVQGNATNPDLPATDLDGLARIVNGTISRAFTSTSP